MTTLAPTSRFRGDAGSVLPEFALVLPFLALIVMGIIEFGFFFRQQNGLAGVAQGGARAGASAGNGRQADKSVLSSVYTEFQSLKQVTISKIVVYKADNANGKVPTGCLSGSVLHSCNLYSATDAQQANAGSGSWASFSDCTNGAGSNLDRFWCPLERVDTLPGPPDWVGVHIEVNYTSFTKFFPWFPPKFTDYAVFREEVTL